MKGNIGYITNDLLCKTIRSVVTPIEHIDEEKLDKLATNYANAIFGKKETHISSKVTVYHSISKEDFKAGYRKAMEE